MNTKTCKGCGWVHPLKTPYGTCRFCGTAFTENVCSRCNEYSQDIIPSTTLCRKCFNKRRSEYNQKNKIYLTTDDYQKQYRRRCKEADERFAAWLNQIKELNVHTLTEEEWLDACRYFNGCALCNSDQIDARGYFIRFEDGGKYNVCNVIPLCDKCATSLKYQSNPFRQMNPYINRNLATYRGLSKDNLERVAEYLQQKIRGVTNERPE